MRGNLAGQTVADRYDILALLGSGGMGEVYRAQDRELDEVVAFKVINPERAADPAALARFRYEVKLARRVTHRNIARTYELGHDAGITYCTMELVDGESLSTILRRGKLATGQVAAIGHGLCEGLAAAHQAGVIHRDIKPGNILLARDGRPMLVDFGVAAVSASATTHVAGTPGYMAPEQARGNSPTPASDIYAVGVVLYEMLTGTRAFTGATARVLAAKQEIEELQLPDDGHTPRELAHLIARATARDPAHRIADATELATALQHWVSAPERVSIPPVSGHHGFELREIILLPPEGDEARMHVALGIHEALLDRLARIPRLRVLPRTTVDHQVDAVIELRVTSALEVRVVRKTGTLQLDLPLAAEDLRSIAEAAAAAIASAVDEARILVDPQLAEATDLWLRARAGMHRNLSATEPLEILERAAAMAPGDFRIGASLAIAQTRHTFFRATTDDSMLDRAIQFVRTALATGNEDADIHNAAALIELNTGEAAAAARHFRAAIACAPYSAEAHDGLGRMLIEAGYFEEGLDRLADARAIAPDLSTAPWVIGRMHALEGRWDEAMRFGREATTAGGPRPTFELRFALWRRDLDALARLRQPYVAVARGFHGPLAEGAFEVLLEGNWRGWRERMMAHAMAPTRIRRRSAFLCQLTAEFASFVGDHATAVDLVVHANGLGMFDLHWIDCCSLLDPIRDVPAFRQARARVERRAQAILDALYGDQDVSQLQATVID